MLADTDMIRAFGGANTAHAAELAAMAARMSALPCDAAATAFGPVGAHFLATLAAAAAHHARAVTALSDSVSAAAQTAHATAGQYDAAESRAAARL